jgi:PKD repeat protein
MIVLTTSLVLGMLVSLVGASAASAAPKTSENVGYIYDFGAGSTDPCGTSPLCGKGEPGSSIFVNALTGSPPAGGKYTTADASKTVTVTDVAVSTIDAKGEPAIEPFDTLILYEVCDIASHPTTMNAINTFLENGGKVMIFDADRCAPGEGGLADYKTFLFPFTTNSPGPKGALNGPYLKVVPSTLTTGLKVGAQEGDAVGDANVFTSFEGPWCTSIVAENTNKQKGIVEASAQTPAGGLAVYEGEDFWFSFKPTPHLRLVFDDILKQNWAPTGLECKVPASNIVLTPPSQAHFTGETATVTAKVTEIENNPVEGVEVTFKVTSGPNAGAEGKVKTNSAGEASFTYTGGPTTGTDEVVATFVDELKKTHKSNTVNVIWEDQKITAAGQNLSGTEGATVTGTVATFSDPDIFAIASDYSATIEWGDGVTSTGTVTGGGGSFSVSGSHIYGEEGSYPITVVITDRDEPSNAATTSSTATIGDASLTAGALTVPKTTFLGSPTPVSFNFSDANAGAPVTDFAATIEWGDGNTTTGTVAGGGGSFTVSGSHTYAAIGSYTVTVTVIDDGGSKTMASAETLVVKPCPASGSINVRWHYSANGSSGSWSGTKSTSCKDGSVVIGPQAMEGDLKVNPGATLKTGYDFTLPGNKTPYTALVENPQVVFQVHCVSGAAPSANTFTVMMFTETYPITNSEWIPSGDQNNPLVYQGATAVPNLCGGGQLRLDKGGAFSATILLF